jgi:outer membrane protein assembly factor BamB
MRKNMNTRLVALSIAVGVASFASAQVEGPVPLAWRWWASTPVSPSGSPVVDGDNVYIGVGGRMYSIDRTSGNRKWQFPPIEPASGFFRGTPLLIEGMLIGTTSNRMAYAVDAQSGQERWSYEAPGNIVGQPAVVGRFVAFNINDEGIMVVNIADGQPAWENPQRVFDRVRGNIAGWGSNVFFFTQRNELYSMNVTTKRADRVARFNTVSPDVTPVVHNDLLYINTGSHIAALNPVNNSVRWQTDTRLDLVHGPAISANGVAVVSRDGRLAFLDANGRLRTWAQGEGRTAQRVSSIDMGSSATTRPAAVGNLFMVPTANGALNLYNPESGELVWTFTIRPLTAGLRATAAAGGGAPQEIISVPAAGAPVVAGNTLLVLAQDGSLLAFDPDAGIDLTGPVVRMNWPTPGMQVPGRNLVLMFHIADEASGVNEKTLQILVNGQETEFEFGRDGVAVVRFTGFNKNRPLGDGRATIQVIVSDWMGNKTEQTYNLMIDNRLPMPAPPAGTPGSGQVGGPAIGGMGGGGGGGSLSGGGR